MILYNAKRGAGGRLILKRWFRIRRSDKNARLEKKVRTYRRLWWWDASRWDQRHGVFNDTD